MNPPPTHAEIQREYAELFAPRVAGIQCDGGWSALIAETLAELRRKCPEARIVQAKEKVAGLGIYLDDKLDERAKEICRRAEERSLSICDRCGAPGVLRGGEGWVAMRCDKHRGDDESV